LRRNYLIKDIKISYNALKLANHLPHIIGHVIERYARATNERIQGGLDKSYDIYGKPFAPLSSNKQSVEARKLKGRKGSRPLIDTGSMRKTIVDANSVRMMGGRSPSTGIPYGVYHNQGFTTKNRPIIGGKQFNFAGAKIPQRQWFGFPERFIRKKKKIIFDKYFKERLKAFHK